MTISLRVLLILVAVFSTWSMLKKIKKFKMQIEYTIFWVLFAMALIIIAIFPDIISVFSKVLGVYSPANLVFALIIFILLVKVFLMTIEISNLETKLKELAQTVAIDELRNKEHEIKK